MEDTRLDHALKTVEALLDGFTELKGPNGPTLVAHQEHMFGENGLFITTHMVLTKLSELMRGPPNAKEIDTAAWTSRWTAEGCIMAHMLSQMCASS